MEDFRLRVKKALEEIIDEQHGMINTQKMVCDYSKDLLKNIKFKKKEYNRLEPFSQTTLTRAIRGGLSEEKYNNVLNFLEALLDEFYGIQYDLEKNTYKKTGEPKNILLPLDKQQNNLGIGIFNFDKFPFGEVKTGFYKAKKVQILQTILPKWPALEIALLNSETIEILLLKPFSQMSRQRGKDLNHSEEGTPFDDLIISSVRMVIRTIKKNNLEGRIRLRFYESCPSISIYKSIYDNDQEDIFMGIFWQSSTTVGSPFLKITSPYSAFGRAVNEHFDNLWRLAEEDVPLEGKRFNLYIENLKEKYNRRHFANPLLKPRDNYFYKVFYARNKVIESFHLELDAANYKARVNKTTSAAIYRGIAKDLGNNYNIILETEEKFKDRIMYLLLYVGGTKIGAKQELAGLYCNISQGTGIPYANSVILKKLNSTDDQEYKNTNISEKEKKQLLDQVLKIPLGLFLDLQTEGIKLPKGNPKKLKYDEDANIAFAASSFYAEKGEEEKARKAFQRALDLGFDDFESFEKESKNPKMKNILAPMLDVKLKIKGN